MSRELNLSEALNASEMDDDDRDTLSMRARDSTAYAFSGSTTPGRYAGSASPGRSAREPSKEVSNNRGKEPQAIEKKLQAIEYAEYLECLVSETCQEEFQVLGFSMGHSEEISVLQG